MADVVGKLVWDATGDRVYETGLSHGVLYPKVAGEYPTGVAWNGLTGFTESPEGAEANDIYADDMLYASLRSAERYGFTIEAFTYPPEFAACDGSGSVVAAKGVSIGQQTRQPFGFSCKTIIGDDSNSEAGYKLHLVYGATAAPSEKAFATINDSPEGISFSWDCDTIPVPVKDFKPTASITIDSRTADATKLAALEKILYGTDATTEPVGAAVAPRLPLPDEVLTLMAAS